MSVYAKAGGVGLAIRAFAQLERSSDGRLSAQAALHLPRVHTMMGAFKGRQDCTQRLQTTNERRPTVPDTIPDFEGSGKLEQALYRNR
jgi:hypothetical protein